MPSLAVISPPVTGPSDHAWHPAHCFPAQLPISKGDTPMHLTTGGLSSCFWSHTESRQHAKGSSQPHGLSTSYPEVNTPGCQDHFSHYIFQDPLWSDDPASQEILSPIFMWMQNTVLNGWSAQGWESSRRSRAGRGWKPVRPAHKGAQALGGLTGLQRENLPGVFVPMRHRKQCPP